MKGRERKWFLCSESWLINQLPHKEDKSSTWKFDLICTTYVDSDLEESNQKVIHTARHLSKPTYLSHQRGRVWSMSIYAIFFFFVKLSAIEI